jgi:hypothetical protein
MKLETKLQIVNLGYDPLHSEALSQNEMCEKIAQMIENPEKNRGLIYFERGTFFKWTTSNNRLLIHSRNGAVLDYKGETLITDDIDKYKYEGSRVFIKPQKNAAANSDISQKVICDDSTLEIRTLTSLPVEYFPSFQKENGVETYFRTIAEHFGLGMRKMGFEDYVASSINPLITFSSRKSMHIEAQYNKRQGKKHVESLVGGADMCTVRLDGKYETEIKPAKSIELIFNWDWTKEIAGYVSRVVES